jgi:hypothetical protein
VARLCAGAACRAPPAVSVAGRRRGGR